SQCVIYAIQEEIAESHTKEAVNENLVLMVGNTENYNWIYREPCKSPSCEIVIDGEEAENTSEFEKKNMQTLSSFHLRHYIPDRCCYDKSGDDFCFRSFFVLRMQRRSCRAALRFLRMCFVCLRLETGSL
ncbi:hypothetical protein NDU88_002731, partial [Pleurodeles waltl]